MKHIYKIVIILVFGILLFPLTTQAQHNDVVFKATVQEVIEEKTVTDDFGESFVLQKLKLIGSENEWKEKEIIFDGTLYEVVGANQYKVDDKVVVTATKNSEGDDVYYVTDYVRQNSIYWLAGIFVLVVILIGRLKGLRALIVLCLTFFIILQFIIPQILDGKNPLFISIIGSLFILIIAIYFTEGFNRNSTISVIAITTSLVLTGVISIIFTNFAKLSGGGDDDIFFLKELLGTNINTEGLLLAGIIIGALGVLDDVVVTQVESINQLKLANPSLKKFELWKKGMKIGVTHMSAMVNTLFLAYAGVALPLLLLFSGNTSVDVTFSNALNNELIATEIIRTLTGSIGLLLAVPLATIMAIHFVKIKLDKKTPAK